MIVYDASLRAIGNASYNILIYRCLVAAFRDILYSIGTVIVPQKKMIFRIHSLNYVSMMLTSSYNTSSVFVCLPVCVCLFPLFTIIWLPCFYVFILFRRNTRARAHTHTRRRISIRNSLHIVLSVKQLQMSRQQQRREEKNAKKTSKLINKSFV